MMPIGLVMLAQAIFGQAGPEGVSYIRFLGGKIDGEITAVAVDPVGNTYVGGDRFSAYPGERVPSDFVLTKNAFFRQDSAGRQGFLAKLDSKGRLIFSTLLPAGAPRGIALDLNGDIYLTGEHLWPGNSTAGVVQPKSRGGGDGHYAGEAYVMRVHGSGSKLVWATNLGGSRYEHARGIHVDNKGRVLAVGWTTSPDYPLTPTAIQKSFRSDNWERGAGWITVIDNTGQQMRYSSFVGESTNAWPTGVAEYKDGTVCVAGNAGPGLTVTDGALNSTGGAFLVKFDLFLPLPKIVYSTYVMKTPAQIEGGPVLDSAGNPIITGYVEPDQFAATAKAYQRSTSNKNVTAFVTKFRADGRGPLFSTLLGGSVSEWGMRVAVDGADRTYIAGRTSSRDFPTTDTAPQRESAVHDKYSEDSFLSVLDPLATRLLYSTFIGGDRSEYPQGLAVNRGGVAIVTGGTASRWFITPSRKVPPSVMGTGFAVRIDVRKALSNAENTQPRP